MRFRLHIRLLAGVLFLAQTATYPQPAAGSESGRYAYFRQAIEEHLQKKTRADSLTAAAYAADWLHFAKREGNSKQQALARQWIHFPKYDRNNTMDNAREMLTAAIKSADSTLMAAAHIKLGAVYFEQNDQTVALDHYLQADRYLVAENADAYLVHKVKYTIAQTKFYLGFYDEALSLWDQCLLFFESDNDRAYLNTLHALGLCYNRLEDYAASNAINKKGIEVGRAVDNRQMERYFEHSQAVNDFYAKRYTTSLQKLLDLLPYFQGRKDYATLAISHFFIAKNYTAMGHAESALPYLLKVDQIFTEEKYIRPELRENYELLIGYYKQKGLQERELHYIKRLLKADSILNRNYRHLSGKIHKEYNTQELVRAKEVLESESLQSRKSHRYIIALLIGVLAVGMYCHLRIQKRNRQRFERFINRPVKQKKEVLKTIPETEIKPEIVSYILKQLEQFETNKKFLEKDLTVNRLAKRFKTNSKYVSRVIGVYKEKRFTEYINDLKGEYVAEKLKTDKRFRLFSNAALATDAGFGSTQIFTRSFKSLTGLTPTAFVAEINKLPPPQGS